MVSGGQQKNIIGDCYYASFPTHVTYNEASFINMKFYIDFNAALMRED